VKPHAIFLRTGCTLPDGLALRQEQFCGTWTSVEDTMPFVLDAKVRSLGWHFMWLEDAYSRFGIGLTATSAIHNAITRALDRVKSRFNTAELNSVKISKYPGFQLAKITLHARHIQQAASLGLIDEMTIRQLWAR
jgi:hypothetical protein